jgi:hypothetical protein
MFVVVALLCVPLAWAGVRLNLRRQERAAIAELERLGGIVYYDWQGKSEVGFWLASNDPNAEPTGPHWVRQILGDDVFSHVVYIWFPIQGSIGFPVGPIVSDDELRLVARLPNLEVLNLCFADVDDSGFAHLQELSNLRSLNLAHSNITDGGLRRLRSLTTLNYLHLDGTRTTPAAVDDLAKALPGCKISGPLRLRR